jgi:Asp/Glu/hydantoin racemase
LLINPNSTRSMTDAMLQSLRPNLPPNVELTGYTAPYPAPTAIESTTDAIMSTEAVLRDLAKHAASNGETVQNFDGMLVACFSKHPLIDALRESYDVPIIGIMEAAIYVARMMGGRFGIVATGQRSKIKQDDDVAAYGLSHHFVGSEATHLGVLELDSRPKEDVAKRVAHASRALVMKGADTILLGCAGMTEMMRAAKDAVRDEDGRRTVNVIDSVEAGIMVLEALIGMGIPTAKKGMFKGEKEGRRTRGQNWL